MVEFERWLILIGLFAAVLALASSRGAAPAADACLACDDDAPCPRCGGSGRDPMPGCRAGPECRVCGGEGLVPAEPYGRA